MLCEDCKNRGFILSALEGDRKDFRIERCDSCSVNETNSDAAIAAWQLIDTLYAQLTRMQNENNLVDEKRRKLQVLYLESETTIVAQIHEIQKLKRELEASGAN